MFAPHDPRLDSVIARMLQDASVNRVQGPEFFSQFPPAGPDPNFRPPADESHLEHMMHSPGAPMLSEGDDFRGSGAEALSNMAALMTGRAAGGNTHMPSPVARPMPRPMPRPAAPASRPAAPVPGPSAPSSTATVMGSSGIDGRDVTPVPYRDPEPSTGGFTRAASASDGAPQSPSRFRIQETVRSGPTHPTLPSTPRPVSRAGAPAVSPPKGAIFPDEQQLNPYRDKASPGVPSGPSDLYPAIGRFFSPGQSGRSPGVPQGPSVTWEKLAALLSMLSRDRAQRAPSQYGFLPRQ